MVKSKVYKSCFYFVRHAGFHAFLYTLFAKPFCLLPREYEEKEKSGFLRANSNSSPALRLTPCSA